MPKGVTREIIDGKLYCSTGEHWCPVSDFHDKKSSKNLPGAKKHQCKECQKKETRDYKRGVDPLINPLISQFMHAKW